MAPLTTARRTKLALAAFGGAALATMTGLAIVTGDTTTADLPPAASPLLPGPMTQGDTVTTTTPPSTLAVEKAVPPVKAKPYGKG
jgi:hypothetical protein